MFTSLSPESYIFQCWVIGEALQENSSRRIIISSEIVDLLLNKQSVLVPVVGLGLFFSRLHLELTINYRLIKHIEALLQHTIFSFLVSVLVSV
jgi:hypothetical protein